MFGGSTGLSNTNDLDAGTQFGNLTFSSTAGAFTLGGNSIVLSGVITSYSTNSETIALPLGGTNGLTNAGPGTVVLTAANTYSGGTAVTAGKLIIATAASLPAGTNLTVGTNALAEFGAIVPAAAQAAVPVPAAAAAASAAVNLAAAVPRIAPVHDEAIQGPPVEPRMRVAALPDTWTGTLNSDGEQDEKVAALLAWDAALAEYGRNA